MNPIANQESVDMVPKMVMGSRIIFMKTANHLPHETYFPRAASRRSYTHMNMENSLVAVVTMFRRGVAVADSDLNSSLPLSVEIDNQ